MTTKKTVVLYPGLGAGHLTPMIELAKLFIRHGVAVTVALVKPPPDLGGALDFPAVVARAAASNPSISFHVPPPPAPSSSSSPGSANADDAPARRRKKHYVLQTVDCLKAMNARLRDFLRSLPAAADALVVDMFCADALDVAADLALPVYYSYSSCAGDLAVFLTLAFHPDIYAAAASSLNNAAGAFVTRCGWNSALEGVAAGLPLLCWPMYAEQRMNKVFVVQEMELGVEMMAGYDGEVVVVAADEVETKVRWVMESDGGRALRERAAAATAIQEGRSSHADFVRFLQDLDNISLSSRTFVKECRRALLDRVCGTE